MPAWCSRTDPSVHGSAHALGHPHAEKPPFLPRAMSCKSSARPRCRRILASSSLTELSICVAWRWHVHSVRGMHRYHPHWRRRAPLTARSRTFSDAALASAWRSNSVCMCVTSIETCQNSRTQPPAAQPNGVPAEVGWRLSTRKCRWTCACACGPPDVAKTAPMLLRSMPGAEVKAAARGVHRECNRVSWRRQAQEMATASGNDCRHR